MTILNTKAPRASTFFLWSIDIEISISTILNLRRWSILDLQCELICLNLALGPSCKWSDLKSSRIQWSSYSLTLGLSGQRVHQKWLYHSFSAKTKITSLNYISASNWRWKDCIYENGHEANESHFSLSLKMKYKESENVRLHLRTIYPSSEQLLAMISWLLQQSNYLTIFLPSNKSKLQDWNSSITTTSLTSKTRKKQNILTKIP